MQKLNRVKRWVPVDLLFAGENGHAGAAASPVDTKYALAPLVTITPYMSALRSISEGDKRSEGLHGVEPRQSMDSGVAREQERQIKRKLSAWGQLLGNAMPAIQSLSQDRLIASDGLLEACIAKFTNKEWIRVRMPESVAELWDSRSTKELDAVCRAQNRTQIYTPIMHPAYRNFKYSRRGHARLDMMRTYLGPRTSGMSLLDIGCNSGYYVFHFRRQGMSVTGIDMDREHLAIAEAQIPMYGLDVNLQNIPLQEFSASEPFDVVLALSVFWHMLGWGNVPRSLSEEELTGKVDRLVGKYLFWESGPDPRREIDLICNNTGLSEFEELGRTSATGIEQRVFGVFKRPSS